MGPGGGWRGQREKMIDKLKEPKPQSLREVPGYLWRVVSKFFYRLFYIFRIVWDTKPWILFFMMFDSPRPLSLSGFSHGSHE